jgi:sec-independent protein translocase protein TatA
MGLGGISVWQLLIVLVIVLLIFGPSRLKNIGSQLGTAIRDFRKTVKENEDNSTSPTDSHGSLDDKSKMNQTESAKQNDQSKL